MPYVGTGLVGNFASTFRDEFTGDGSNTNFTLSRNAHHENDLEVFVGNVRQQPGDAYTVSGTTLAFTGTPANGEVIYVVHQAGALQTVQAPTDHGARDFNITGDANKITFGDDSEITMTHVADSGLALKNTNTGDDKPFTLVLQTGETDIAANDKLGVINFQAPDEGTGTDAILVAAGIEAVSEGDFSSSSNATKLSFKTASSAAAAETMSLSSGGNLIVSGNVSVGGDLDVTGSFDMSDANITNVGSIALDSISGDADSNTSITFSGSDVITFATGGSTAFTANADQTVTFSAAVSGTSADFDGGVTIDNITIDGTEIDLSSGDLTVDVAGDIILDADGGEVLFHDATTAIGHVSMDSSNLTIKSLVSDKDIIFQGNDGGSGITALTLDMSASGAATFNSSVTLGGGLVIPDGGDIGSASDLNAIGISSGGVISITATTANTNASDGALTVAGGVGIAADLSVGDDLRLISDSAVLSFGADGDITLTHNADTGLTLNGKLVATELDISGNIDVDGTTNLDAVDVDGTVNFAADVTFADGADIVTASAGTSNFRAGVNAGNSIASGGNYNVVIGDEAGTALTTGDANTAIGFEALKTEDANGFNTGVGYQALKTLNAGADSYNTAVGYQAGLSITTGLYNTIVGGIAGDGITSGTHNTAIGMGALNDDTQGNKSTAVGQSALTTQNFTSSTDSHNTAVGYQAGGAVTTGTQNTLIGGLAGDALTDAGSNVAIGYGALTSDTKGNKSTAIGLEVLGVQNFTSSTDTYNTAVGFQAGASVTTGYSNTFIGGRAGDAVTDGFENTFLGSSAGTSVTTGDRNLFVGNNAGEVATEGNNNTFVGANGTAGSCGGAMTTGSKNTILGGYTGNQSGLDIRTGNNYIVLSDGDGNPRIMVHGDGYFHASSDPTDSEFFQSNSAHSISSSNTQPALFVENSGSSGNAYGLVIDFTDVAPDNNTSYFFQCQDSSTIRLKIWGDGDVVNHDNSYGAISDIKLKEQITDASSQWDDIKALQIRKYKMKEDVATGDSDAHWRLGVVAQEVETAGMSGLVKNNPDLIENEDGELVEGDTTTKSVKYSILYMKAVKALQEAMTRIETLEAKVTALEGE